MLRNQKRKKGKSPSHSLHSNHPEFLNRWAEKPYALAVLSEGRNGIVTSGGEVTRREEKRMALLGPKRNLERKVRLVAGQQRSTRAKNRNYKQTEGFPKERGRGTLVKWEECDMVHYSKLKGRAGSKRAQYKAEVQAKGSDPREKGGGQGEVYKTFLWRKGSESLSTEQNYNQSSQGGVKNISHPRAVATRMAASRGGKK